MSKTLKERLDGWVNVLTNLGVLGKDKRLGSAVEMTAFDQTSLEALYQTDDVAARIVDRLPEEMMREGYALDIEGDEGDQSDAMLMALESKGIDAKIELAMKWGRLYGGAGMIFGLKDGQTADKPVDFNNIKGIDYVAVLDRYRLQADSQSVIKDVSNPAFGKPAFYQLSSSEIAGMGVNSKIHHTRIVRFEGAAVPVNQQSQFNYWGDSVLTRLYNALRNFQTGHDSTATLLHDFAVPVMKLKGLADLIASGDDALVLARLRLIQTQASVINAVVLDDGEEYERKTTVVTGLAELIRLLGARLVAATDMPHTILLGESPSGLGATGSSEKRDWYDHIANKQESLLRPALREVMKFFFAAKDGPTKGKVPEEYAIEFNPLWQISEKEQVDIRKVQADVDAIYVDRGIIDPDEVADSRFGGASYSTDTKLSETRKEPRVNPKQKAAEEAAAAKAEAEANAKALAEAAAKAGAK